MFNQYKFNRSNFNVVEIWEVSPSGIGVTVVRAKTRKWGSGGAQCTTSTGTFNGSSAYGSGGFNYDGNMGDAEGWTSEG